MALSPARFGFLGIFFFLLGVWPLPISAPSASAVSFHSTVPISEPNIEPIGHIGGAAALAVQGSYAYAGIGAELVVLDVSYPANIRRIGGIVFGSKVVDVAVDGQTAYVSTGDRFLVVDISHGAQPRLLTSLPIEARVVIPDSRNGIVYLLGFDLTVIDVSLREAPVVVHRSRLQGRIVHAVRAGDYIYIAGGESGLAGAFSIVDLSNPKAPEQVFYEVFPSLGYSGIWVVVTDRYAYVSTERGRAYVYDISDPVVPVSIMLWDFDVRAIAGTLVYSTALDTFSYGLAEIDISAFGNPTLVGQIDFSGDSVQDFVWDGRRVYLARGELGLQVIDVSVPGKPAHMGNYRPALSGVTESLLAGEGGIYAVTGADPHELQLVSLPDLATLAVLGSVRMDPDAVAVALWENHAYIALEANSGWRGQDRAGNPSPPPPTPQPPRLQVVDVSGLATSTVEVVSTTALPHTVSKIALSGGFAYLMDEAGLRILDVSDPASPQLRGALPYPEFMESRGHRMVVADEHVYLLEPWSPMFVVNVSAPDHPVLAGVYPDWMVSDLVAYGHHLYLTTPTNLIVVDAKDSNHLVEIGRLTFPEPVSYLLPGPTLAIQDGYLVGVWPDMIQIFDITDPSHPVLADAWYGFDGGETSTSARSWQFRNSRHLAIQDQLIYAGSYVFWYAQPKAYPIPPEGAGIEASERIAYQFPANSFPEATTVVHRLPYPGRIHSFTGHGLLRLGQEIRLDAVAASGQPVQLQTPFTIVVHYDQPLVAGMDETKLALYRWEDERWTREPTSQVDVDENRVTATVNRMGRWALLADTEHVYLPNVQVRH